MSFGKNVDRRIILSLALRVGMVILTIVAAVFSVSTMLNAIREEKRADLMRREALLASTQNERDQLQGRIDALLAEIAQLRSQVHASSSSIDHAPLTVQGDRDLQALLMALPGKVSLVESKLEALREALDPTGEEALLLARLKDRVVALDEERKDYEERLLQQFDRFERSVEQRLESSSESVRWLFVVLVPLILNFLYTVWKDWRTDRDRIREAVKPSETS